jgi:hypothetical protein
MKKPSNGMHEYEGARGISVGCRNEKHRRDQRQPHRIRRILQEDRLEQLATLLEQSHQTGE